MRKLKLNIADQILHMESKGITFNHISKESARQYLEGNNNYFKLTAYRKNFLKHSRGPKLNQYLDLDFSYLKDLAVIDMRLRYLLLRMCLDVEHFSKVRLMKALEQSEDNGYDIVESYKANLSSEQRKFLETETNRNLGNPYCGDLIEKYKDALPAWAFIEIIPFGRYISFYQHCAKYLSNTKMWDEGYLLIFIKDLRNATAHSNCILNDLHPETSKYKTNHSVLRELKDIGSPHIRQKKMSNARIQQIVTLMYAHNLLVTSEGVHKHQSIVSRELITRMLQNINYYTNSPMVSTTFNFLKEVVDKWF